MIETIGKVLGMIVGAAVAVAGYILFFGGTAFVITAGIEMAKRLF